MSEENDIVMKEKSSSEEVEGEAPKEEFDILLSDLLSCISLVCKGVETSNDRFIGRAIRISFKRRNKYTPLLLSSLVDHIFLDPDEKMRRIRMLLSLPSNDLPPELIETRKIIKIPTFLPIEVTLFTDLLILIFLVDSGKNDNSVQITCLNHADKTIENLKKHNRTTLLQLGAKIYFYYSRAHELYNPKGIMIIRSELFHAFRSASVRGDLWGQSSLMNLILRNYLEYQQYTAADDFLSQTEVDFNSNAQESRYCYYKGRILAVQLDYADALENLQLALQKSPSVAKGFRLSTYKLCVLVQLLMGDIPDRSLFSHPTFGPSLTPYFELTQFVRNGDVVGFKGVLSKYKELFVRDRNLTLCQRIRKNVIRTGLNKITLSYSRISFADICEKLKFDRPEDIECIVAKAIKDGIITAKINHEGQYMEIEPVEDVYDTFQPTEELNEKILYCFNLRNEAVKAMVYADDKQKDMLRKWDEKEQEKEEEEKKRKRREERRKKKEKMAREREEKKRRKELLKKKSKEELEKDGKEKKKE